MALPQPCAERTIRKIDIAQVSLNLQDRLGLAKVKYLNGRLRALEPQQQDRPLEIIPQESRQATLGSDKPSDSSSEISHSRYDTPSTSPPPRTAMYSKELPRSKRNNLAATFHSEGFLPMLEEVHKRARELSKIPISKRPRPMWMDLVPANLESPFPPIVPESSPGFNRRSTNRRPYPSFMSDGATIPDVSSPTYQGHSDDENDPDLPSHSFQHPSSIKVNSSPPRTPPPKRRRLSRSERAAQNKDGADLLLYLANSPTPASVAAKGQFRDFPPSTPPSQHAVLPSMTPTPGGGGAFGNLSTPNQQFNFADFVNVTPSPAQPAWGGRTPGGPSRTPRAIKDTRKKLNFDALVPPTGESPKLGTKSSAGLALQLGGDLRP